MGFRSRNTPEWQQSHNAVNAAQDAHTQACIDHGDNSPEAFVAREQADAAANAHFSTYGNPGFPN